jgi:hypothetical protein
MHTAEVNSITQECATNHNSIVIAAAASGTSHIGAVATVSDNTIIRPYLKLDDIITNEILATTICATENIDKRNNNLLALD